VRIHASRESSLEGIHLIVVCGRGLTGFLLHLIAHRLRRLLLDFLPNHAAFAGCKTSQRPANRTRTFSRFSFSDFGVTQESNIFVA
jgi:hypothetical protein